MTEFESMLSGGHPNSLGRTMEVVDVVLADGSRLDDLYQCYFSDDEVVRLRVSSAMKRVTIEHPDWAMDFIDGLQTEVAAIASGPSSSSAGTSVAPVKPDRRSSRASMPSQI